MSDTIAGFAPDYTELAVAWWTAWWPDRAPEGCRWRDSDDLKAAHALIAELMRQIAAAGLVVVRREELTALLDEIDRPVRPVTMGALIDHEGDIRRRALVVHEALAASGGGDAGGA